MYELIRYNDNKSSNNLVVSLGSEGSGLLSSKGALYSSTQHKRSLWMFVSDVGDPNSILHEEEIYEAPGSLDVDLSHSNVLYAITASLSRDCHEINWNSQEVTVVSDVPECWKQDCCLTAGATPESSTPWIVDSGATCHISPWQGDFVSIYRAEGSIKLGDKSTVSVAGHGNINWRHI